ncbi:MAG TPA: hypothetical protein VMC03_07400 [Streptosporangiaceae bacterium]|nr:hypothetical protein [Streptosporangiaceae bacterium]
MSFEGMDADQLGGLAAQIDRDAQTLSGLVTTMTGVVAQLTLFWYGPMVAVFEQDWQAKYRPSLLAAYGTLTALHAHLVSNIDQQTSASAADGGWTAERVVGDFENVLTGVGLVGMTGLLAGTPVSGAVDGLGDVGTAVGAYQTEHEMFDTGEELAQGHYVAAANDFTEGVGDGLETAGGAVMDKNFVLGVTLTVAGVDVKLADQVANLDWKDTPSPFSGSNFQQDYVPFFKSMGTGAFWDQAGQTLFGDM